MVSLLTLAALSALLALPPGTQPRKIFAMTFPRKVVLGPRNVLVPTPPKPDTCSVPLLNALKGQPFNGDSRMPAVKPSVTGTIRLVDPPAPPCAE